MFATFFNKIKNFDTTRVVKIAYGAAKFDPSGKGELPVPTTMVFRECAYRFKTKLVDEYLTTKIHYESNTVLKKVKVKGKQRCLRGLLWSGTPNDGKFVSRDKNAALNILRCALEPVRPVALCRKSKKTVQEIGKIIKDCRKNKCS